MLTPARPLVVPEDGELVPYALLLREEAEEAASRARRALGLGDDRIGVTVCRGSLWQAVRTPCAEHAYTAVVMDAGTAGRSLRRMGGAGCRLVVFPAVAPSPLPGNVIAGPWLGSASGRR